MNESFQCGVCRRYLDAGGMVLMPQPRFRHDKIGVPTIITCLKCRMPGERAPVGIERSLPPEPELRTSSGEFQTEIKS